MFAFRTTFRVPSLARSFANQSTRRIFPQPACSLRSSLIGCNRSLLHSVNQPIRSSISLFHSAAKLRTHQPNTLAQEADTNYQSTNQSNQQSSNQSKKSYTKLFLQVGGATILVGLVGWHASSQTQDIHSFLNQSVMPKLNSINQFASGVEILGYHLSPAIMTICAINLAVFLAWRIPGNEINMMKHFTYDLPSFLRGRFYTPITSAFSHHGGAHLLFNTVALVSMAPAVQIFLSDVDFSSFYLVTAFGSSLIGSLITILMYGGRNIGSLVELRRPALGASGAVFAVFALNALIFPDNKYNIMFIPYDIPASTLLPCLIGFDVAGLLYSRFTGKATSLGHGAHLGGVMLGALFYWLVMRNNPKVTRVQEEVKRRKQWAALQQKMKQPWQ